MQKPTLKRPIGTLIFGGIAVLYAFLLASVFCPMLTELLYELPAPAQEKQIFLMVMDTLSSVYYATAVINALLVLWAYFARAGATFLGIFNVLMFILNGFILMLIPFIFNAIAGSKAKKAHITYKAELKAYKEFSAEA